MISGAPGTPGGDIKAEQAKVQAEARTTEALGKVSLLETFQRVQRVHISSCSCSGEVCKTSVSKCNSAAPLAETIISQHLIHDARTWMEEECEDLKTRVTQNVALGIGRFGTSNGTTGDVEGMDIAELTETAGVCKTSVEALNQYLIDRNVAIREILGLKINEMSDSERKKKKEQCLSDMEQFKKQDLAVAGLWGDCEGRISHLKARLTSSLKQKFERPNGYYELLSLESPDVSVAEIQGACTPVLASEDLTKSDDRNTYENVIKAENLAEMQLACSILLDPISRKKYDQEDFKEYEKLYEVLLGDEERKYVCEPLKIKKRGGKKTKEKEDCECPGEQVCINGVCQCPESKPTFDNGLCCKIGEQYDEMTKICGTPLCVAPKTYRDPITEECSCPLDSPDYVKGTCMSCSLVSAPRTRYVPEGESPVKGVTECAAKIPPQVPSAPSAPAVEIPEIPLVENQTETSETSETSETPETPETPAEVLEEIKEEEKEDRQEELEEEKNLPTPTEPEEPPSKVEGCRYPREIKDEKSGFCRPRYKKDCGDPGYIDPISQQCQDLPANDGQYATWSLQLCNQYLDGVKTFYETLLHARDIVTMNGEVRSFFYIFFNFF